MSPEREKTILRWAVFSLVCLAIFLVQRTDARAAGDDMPDFEIARYTLRGSGGNNGAILHCYLHYTVIETDSAVFDSYGVGGLQNGGRVIPYVNGIPVKGP